MTQFDQFWRPKICPKCKKPHITDDWHCEHCLHDFSDEGPHGIDAYGRWM